MSNPYKYYNPQDAPGCEVRIFSSVDETGVRVDLPPQVNILYDGPADSVDQEVLMSIQVTQQLIDEWVEDANLTGDLPGPADKAFIYWN